MEEVHRTPFSPHQPKRAYLVLWTVLIIFLLAIVVMLVWRPWNVAAKPVVDRTHEQRIALLLEDLLKDGYYIDGEGRSGTKEAALRGSSIVRAEDGSVAWILQLGDSDGPVCAVELKTGWTDEGSHRIMRGWKCLQPYLSNAEYDAGLKALQRAIDAVRSGNPVSEVTSSGRYRIEVIGISIDKSQKSQSGLAITLYRAK